MTSKEALEKISNHKCYVKESNCYDRVKDLYKNEIEVIEQDLERLEQLEEENQDLKFNETMLTNYAYDLKLENEKLKKEIKELKEALK